MDAMQQKESFRELKKEFESTLWELIPGILHNFANSLTGILGRSEILQGRAEHFKLIIKNNDNIDAEVLESCKKIIYDTGLIAKEADRFFCLFNDVAGKFQRLNDTALQRINLSELIEFEMAFLQFYPDFKHKIKLNLTLDRKIPEVLGIKADYSISLSAMIRHSLNTMKDSELKELIVSTSYDDSHVCVKIKDTGTPVADDCFLHGPDEDREFFHELSILKKYGVFFQITHESGFNIMSIRIPY